jgi:acetyl esterase/lipase
VTIARRLLLGVVAVALSACGAGTSGGATGVTAPKEVVRDVAYAPPEPAESRGHLLDLHLPDRTGQPVPLVLWSHGSGWLEENGQEGADAVAARLNPLGIAVAGVAVRSSTYARFPGQRDDVKAAIRFLKNDAARYGLDPERFAVMGESSGGWAAAMAAVTGNRPDLEGDLGVRGPSSRVAAAVLFYPPTDFLQADDHMIDCGWFNEAYGVRECHSDPDAPESLLLGCPIRSCPDRVAEANPVTYVDQDTPPVLILHGTDDLVVPHHQSELLLEALRAACRPASLISLSGGDHGSWEPWFDGRMNPRDMAVWKTTGCEAWQDGDAPDSDVVVDFLRQTIGQSR